MTARKPTRGSRDNGSVGYPDEQPHDAAQDPDAQQILEYLEQRGGCTLDELAGKLRLPRAYLKQLLSDLEDDGYIEVTAGFSAVSIERVDSRSEPVADGGRDQADSHPIGDAIGGVELAARDLYQLIGNDRRRQAIRLLGLLTAEGPQSPVAGETPLEYVTVSTLADLIAATEADSPVDEHAGGESDARTSVYVTLSQTHLPLLERFDAIRYHERPQKVEAQNSLAAIAGLVDVVDSASARHPRRTDARRQVRQFYRDGEPATGSDRDGDGFEGQP